MKKDGLIDVIKSKHLGEGTHYGRPVMVYPDDLASAVRLWILQNLPPEGVFEVTAENKQRGEGLTMGWNMCLAQVKERLL